MIGIAGIVLFRKWSKLQQQITYTYNNDWQLHSFLPPYYLLSSYWRAHLIENVVVRKEIRGASEARNEIWKESQNRC